MTKTISFETTVENGYIKIPFDSASSIRKAKVILKWNDGVSEQEKKQKPKLPYLGIDMTGYKFDREEANAR